MKSKLKNIIAITLGLIAFPNLNFAQAPNLGTAANFVLFTSVGAVTNTGITHLTGNVGTNSGLSTGFGNVDGVMHDGDGTSGLASADLTLAYNQLNADVPTFFPAPLLGNGQILFAGVNAIAGPSTLNLDLILDAQGNPNAVFVFQIAGSFSANANSKVKLINSAKACNVFWKVEGLVSLATGVSMKGTIVANNAAINLNTGDTLEGRALSTAGAITTNGVLAYTPIGCGSPLLTGPIAPVLGSIACYELFSTIGPVTNVGVTNVIGDIGSDNGTTTGFNPLLVVGMIHPVPDGSTALCATDLLTVYNYVNLLPYDIELLYPAQFGSNLVLTPHTYRMNSACTFTDTLYLDAENDPNAVFLIQINGALSTSTFSKVNLINGAQAKNVFWKVEGAVSIANNSIFNGTIICNNGAVNLLTAVAITGRVLTTTGAVNTAAITASIPVGDCGNLAPTITSQPNNQTVCSGSSASFTVVATGSGLTYQWRKGLVNLIDGGNISGALTATLTINPATALDAALNYNCVITGTFAPPVTSANASLTISTSPTITSQPANQTTCVGGSVGFTVVASGSGLTYQWRKGLVNLINGGNISGATSPTLTINPATALDAALNYNVVVTGCLPSATSVNASLTIDTPPSITTQPNNQITCSGNSVSFTVVATGSNLTYQWRKGLVNLINGGNISGALTATLTINPATALDAALNYNVVVTGACLPNSTSANASLTIDVAPSITSQPVGQTVCSGNSASFSVVSTGTGLTYQWRKGLVNLINGGNISGALTATLTVNPTTALDAAANYNVVVTGACLPNATSTNASLTVDAGAVITSQPNNQIVCEGSSVSFSVVATGTGLTYQWRKGIVNLINGGNISGATSSTLTINPVALSDAALNYNVVISGTCSPNTTSGNSSLVVDPTPVAFASSNSPICTDSTLNLMAQTVVGATYNWIGPNGYSSNQQNPTIVSATAVNDGSYSLTVMVNGCTSTPSTIAMVVFDCGPRNFFIPEGFSPNGDGTNDLFVIRGIEYYPKNTFVIFNRWGDKIFEASPYTSTWNGTSTMGIRMGGDVLPVGTYFYVLDLKDGSSVYKGTIYLNR